MQLDYSLKTPEERVAYTQQLIAKTPKEELTARNLEYLSNYILFINDKDQTKKEKKKADGGILTKNRMATVDKREISFEGLIASLENGEDGIYNLIANDKNQFLDHKSKITQEDLKDIPTLQEYYDTIQKCEEKLKRAKGRDRYILKKQIIEIWQAMYIIKSSFYGTPIKTGVSKNQIKAIAHMSIDEHITINENGMPVSDNNISLLNPDCISVLLCYYSQFKQESIDDFQSDMRFMLMDLEDLAEKALLPHHQFLYDLLILKIDGLTNKEIQEEMRRVYGEDHSESYYSKVWRKQIPRLIAEEAQKQYLIWYYTNIEKGQWKQCTKCKQIKLAHPMFFSKNTTKDGFYSQCKDCKNGKS